MKRVTTFTIVFAMIIANTISSIAQDKSGITIIKDTLCIVKTDSAAFLNSSFGENRLGGNKINFIDKDIFLKVTGHTKSLYKVALSQNRYAYIPKDVTIPVDSVSVPPFISFQRSGDSTALLNKIMITPALSGSFGASNRGKEDMISLALEHACPYMVREETDPHRIIVDLFGVANNSVWLTQSLDLQSIESVDIQQTDSDIATLIINLKKKSSWGYNIRYDGNRLNISVKHLPDLKLRGMIIGLDAGHGGKATGAVSVNGDKEKELNMEMIYTLKKLLEKKGAKVVLSRDGDIDVTMQKRKEIFRDNNIDMMISVHCNAGGKGAQGSSTYYKHIVYKPLAEIILRNILTIKGVKEFGLVGNFNFSLSAATNYPTVLVETLFLSNPEDTQLIENPSFRNEMMKKVVKGVQDYLKYCKKLDNN